MLASAGELVHGKNALDIFKPLLIGGERGPEHAGSGATLAGNGGGEKQETALREIRCQRHIQQAALAGCPDLRQAAQGIGQLAVADDAQAARSFRDDIGAVRQHLYRPWMFQPIDDSFHPDIGILRCNDVSLLAPGHGAGHQKTGGGKGQHLRRGAKGIFQWSLLTFPR